jgi:hypothetical protein
MPRIERLAHTLGHQVAELLHGLSADPRLVREFEQRAGGFLNRRAA